MKIIKLIVLLIGIQSLAMAYTGSYQVNDIFLNNSKIIYELIRINQDVSIDYDSAIQQVDIDNRSDNSLSVAVTYFGTTLALGDFGPNLTPSVGQNFFISPGTKFYFTPDGKFNADYSVKGNNAKVILQDLTLIVDNIVYSFDMNNQNINDGTIHNGNRILISGLSTPIVAVKK